MSGPQGVIFAEQITPESVEAHIRHAHRLRAIAYALWLRKVRRGVKRLFVPRPRVAVKRPQPRPNLPHLPALR